MTVEVKRGLGYLHCFIRIIMLAFNLFVIKVYVYCLSVSYSLNFNMRLT